MPDQRYVVINLELLPGPDLDGNVIPPGTQEGSAEIVGIEADNQSILVGMDSSVYNVRKATCNPHCITCSGAATYLVTADPFSVGVSQTASEQFLAQWSNGKQYNYTSEATWSSSNTAVATVTGPGNTQGVSAGSFVLSASDLDVEDSLNGCVYLPSCPNFQGGGGSAPGTSMPTITSISPAQGLVGTGINVTITGTGFAAGATVNAGSNISVTNVDFKSETQLTATFTPTNSTSAGGNQAVIVTVSELPSNSQNFYVQYPNYFVTSSYAPTSTPSACTASGGIGYFISLNNFVADQQGDQITAAGIDLQESVSGGTWQTSYATPPVTLGSGTFTDTPFGGCYITTGQFCAAGHTITHQASVESQTYAIPTTYNSTECTEGIQVVITGNLPSQNQSITSGTVN